MIPPPDAGGHRAPGDPEDPYAFFERPDVVREYEELDFLLPPEQAVLDELAPRLKGARILDIGVGAGRTAAYLIPLASDYLGIDVSVPMIEGCRRRFPLDQYPTASFAVADARAMPEVESGAWDLVVFSFNGLDVVGPHEDREKALGEMVRACRPGGAIFFSADNLAFAERRFRLRAAVWTILTHPVTRKDPTTLLRRPGRWKAVLGEVLRRRQANPGWRRLGQRQHAIVIDERFRYEYFPQFFDAPGKRIRMQKYYIRPAEQIRQLRGLGLKGVRVFAQDGDEVTHRVDQAMPEWWWLYYLAWKPNGTSRAVEP